MKILKVQSGSFQFSFYLLATLELERQGQRQRHPRFRRQLRRRPKPLHQSRQFQRRLQRLRQALAGRHLIHWHRHSRRSNTSSSLCRRTVRLMNTLVPTPVPTEFQCRMACRLYVLMIPKPASVLNHITTRKMSTQADLMGLPPPPPILMVAKWMASSVNSAMLQKIAKERALILPDVWKAKRRT